MTDMEWILEKKTKIEQALEDITSAHALVNQPYWSTFELKLVSLVLTKAHKLFEHVVDKSEYFQDPSKSRRVCKYGVPTNHQYCSCPAKLFKEYEKHRVQLSGSELLSFLGFQTSTNTRCLYQHLYEQLCKKKLQDNVLDEKWIGPNIMTHIQRTFGWWHFAWYPSMSVVTEARCVERFTIPYVHHTVSRKLMQINTNEKHNEVKKTCDRNHLIHQFFIVQCIFLASLQEMEQRLSLELTNNDNLTEKI